MSIDADIPRIAAAMKARRAELITKPLERIWHDLAEAGFSAIVDKTDRQPASPEDLVKKVRKAISDNIRVDATGLSPAVIGHFISGFDEAAEAVIAVMRPPREEASATAAMRERWAELAEAAKLEYGKPISKDLGERIKKAIAEQERLDEAKTTISTILLADDWQEIRSAPSHGEPIWVFGGRYSQPTVVPADGDWWNSLAAGGSKSQPTHWRHRHPPRPPARMDAPLTDKASTEASLINAAPDMLHALEPLADLLDIFEQQSSGRPKTGVICAWEDARTGERVLTVEMLRDARAAVVKAKGKAS